MPRYGPADSLKSPRFTGPFTFARLPHVTDLEGVDLAVTGVPFDTGTSYRVGGRFGPAAVRDASMMLRPYNPNVGRRAVRGPVVRRPRRHRDRARLRSSRATSAIEAAVGEIVAGRGRAAPDRRRSRLHPGPPPGDALPRPGRRHRLRRPHRRLGQLLRPALQPWHVDAPGHRGGPGRRRPTRSRSACAGPSTAPTTGRSCGPTSGLDYLTTEDVLGTRCRRPPPSGSGQRVGDRPTWLTFDIDVVDPRLRARHRHARAGRTCRPTTRWPIVRSLHSIDFVGFDVVEVIPAYDPAGQTAFLAANLAYEMLSLVALRRR